MSVHREEYVIVGYKLPYKLKHKTDRKKTWEDEEEKFESYIDFKKGAEYVMVVDGMNGEYLVFGKLIAKGDEYDGLGFIEVDPSKYDSDEIFVRFAEVFEDYVNAEEYGDPKVLAFTHWH